MLIGGLPAARMGDLATCVGPPDTIARGSSTVLIGGFPAARMGDMCAHGGSIVVGMPTVLIGDAGGGKVGGGTAANGECSKSEDAESAFDIGFEYKDEIKPWGEESSLKAKAEYNWLDDENANQQWRKFGDDENNIRIGAHDKELKSSVSFDVAKHEFDITPLDGKYQVSAITAQASGEALKGLVSAKASGELLSAEAHGKIGATWKDGGGEAGGELGASAVLVQAKGEGSVRVTPKTIYDNTLGRLTNSSLPKSWDKGISLGGSAEAGIGAAAEAKASVEKSAGVVSMTLELKAGAGPMAGFSGNIGLVW